MLNFGAINSKPICGVDIDIKEVLVDILINGSASTLSSTHKIGLSSSSIEAISAITSEGLKKTLVNATAGGTSSLDSEGLKKLIMMQL